MEQKYFTGCLPLLTPNNSFKTCGGPEAFTSTTIFKKCGGKKLGRDGTFHPENILRVSLPRSKENQHDIFKILCMQ